MDVTSFLEGLRRFLLLLFAFSMRETRAKCFMRRLSSFVLENTALELLTPRCAVFALPKAPREADLVPRRALARLDVGALFK